MLSQDDKKNSLAPSRPFRADQLRQMRVAGTDLGTMHGLMVVFRLEWRAFEDGKVFTGHSSQARVLKDFTQARA